MNRRFDRPNALERLFNKLFGFLLASGLGLPHYYLLQVRGRRTGRLHSTPVNVLVRDGQRFLVAGRGYTQWVRNAVASGTVSLKKGRKREDLQICAVSDDEKPEILKAYLDRFRLTVQRYFPVPAGSPPEAFRPLVTDYPVFELLRQRSASRIPCLGYLPSASAGSSPAGRNPTLEALRQGLADLGYVDGRTLVIEPRWAEGQVERLPELAADLVQLDVDIIVTLGGVATRAAKNATATIPIVFAVVIDPVASGLVADRQRPGGNLTGFTSFDPQEMRPHLELLKESLPGLARVTFLGDASLPGSPEASRAWDQQQAQAAGLQAHSLRIRGPSPDLDGAFEAARREGAQAVLVLEMPATIEHRHRIAASAIRHRLPTLFVGGYGDAGGLIAYGTSRVETGQRVAAYVDRILKGAQPGTLPVERLTRYELIVNLKTARELGVTLAPALLQRADRVIE
jgi:putative ABC transport system substrate-binding protein